MFDNRNGATAHVYDNLSDQSPDTFIYWSLLMFQKSSTHRKHNIMTNLIFSWHWFNPTDFSSLLFPCWSNLPLRVILKMLDKYHISHIGKMKKFFTSKGFRLYLSAVLSLDNSFCFSTRFLIMYSILTLHLIATQIWTFRRSLLWDYTFVVYD